MAADLGTWPAEQATVLLEVLQAGGLHPDARRVRGEVHVTVPEDEGDKAHATLVANMDRIAQAARPTRSSGGRGRGGGGKGDGGGASRSAGKGRGKLRAVDGGRSDRGSGRSKPAGGRSSGPSGGGVGAGVIAAVGFGTAFTLALAGGSPAFPLVLMTGALVWVLGRRAERGM